MTASKETTSQPNILWICTDEQRLDTLGCYGNPFVLTPHIDQLALSGVRFNHAYVQCPVCTPSRSSFLTGRYPRTTRNRQNGQAIDASEILIPKIFRDHGYYTGLVGKLHLSPCSPDVSPFGEPRTDDGYVEFHWSNSPNPKWPNNEYSQWLMRKGKQFQTKPYNGSKYVHQGMSPEYHQTRWVADTAIRFIETTAHFNHPWFLSVNPTDPHFPLDPPIEYLERYLDILEDIPLPKYVSGELENKPNVQKADHIAATNQPGRFSYGDMTDFDQQMIRAAYWAMVDQIDVQIGRIIDMLHQTGQYDNTIIIFMSDHGDMLGDHGIHLKGPYFYDPLIRVPLIISGPGVIANKQRQALIELVDLAPTLLEASGMPFYPGMQGKSFLSLLTEDNQTDHHREDIYAESYNASWRTWDRKPREKIEKYEQKEDLISQPFTTMLRTNHHKLVVYHGEEMGELYDLQTDPNETTNLWSDQEYKNLKMQLLLRMCDRMAWTSDPLPERISPF